MLLFILFIQLHVIATCCANFVQILYICTTNKHFNIMATVKAFIRISTKKSNDINVRFRLSDGRNIQLFHKSELTVNSDLWDKKNQCIKAKVIFNTEKRTTFNKAVMARKEMIIDIYNANPKKDELTSDLLDIEIDKVLNPHKYVIQVEEEKQQTFFEAFDEFLIKRKISDVRKNNFKVVKRALQRYEVYKAVKHIPVALHFDTITSDTLRDIEEFLRNEHQIFIDFPEIYKLLPEKRTPQKRGQNTINDIFTKLRLLYLWAIEVGKTHNNPFKGFAVEECVYGTPFYISVEERNILYNANLEKRPPLAVQRDIFVFQCLIGCRIGDLYKMTKDNVMNGAIEYVPRKTKDGRPITVRVPLNTTVLEILKRYPDCEKLLPFISEQKYNLAIKEMFRLAGLI